MKALILAGSQGDSPLKELNDVKSLIKINGKEMILYVIDAIKELEFIDQIVVVGDKEKLEPVSRSVDVIIEEGDSLTENVLKGAQYFSDDEEILVLTCDIPMITSEAIQDFIDKTRLFKAEFYYPIISKEVNDKKFPGVHRTFVKIKDGTFTGGNIFLVTAGAIKKNINKIESFLVNRKKPLMMLKTLGVFFILKFLFGVLCIADIEKRVKQLFNVEGRAIISNYAEIGTDVDKFSDLEIASRVLGQEGF